MDFQKTLILFDLPLLGLAERLLPSHSEESNYRPVGAVVRVCSLATPLVQAGGTEGEALQLS